MNLNYLHCFLTLSENLSFTKTARELSITQPSVSRQIKLLEEQLNTQLFVRDKHRVQLTSAGKELKSSLNPLIAEIRRVLNLSIEKTRQIEGPLSFACLPEVGQYFFMGLLLEFGREHPGIDLRVQYLLETEILEKLKSGTLDFGIISQPVISESIRSYRLMEERSVLVTRTGNATKLGALKDTRFVAYNEEDTLLSGFLKRHYKHSEIASIKRISTVNSHKSMLDALLEFDCYAVLPFFSVQEQIKKGTLKIVSEKETRNSLYLVHVESPSLPKKNDVFRRFLMDRCKSRVLTE